MQATTDASVGVKNPETGVIDEAATLAEPIAAGLGIALHRVPELPAFAEALIAAYTKSRPPFSIFARFVSDTFLSVT